MNSIPMRRSLRATIVVCAILLGWQSGTNHSAMAQEPAALMFNRDIRPILAENCFACHGFDAKQRKGGLRLDTVEGATARADSGRIALVPGKSHESEFWRRISSGDPDEKMPPAESQKSLTAEEVAILKRWIDHGATYQRHWAFEPPVRPEIKRDGNPIDNLIRQKLAAVGLKLSPEADRETLIRRVTLDLTGLPPTLAEIDQFLLDQTPQAYDKLVDRLLASPQYGERMAGFWLDVARYGDTNGYLHDIMRTGWPWRDWVIKAFNDDLPFDQFVTLQLAGDLQPEATPEQILPTAFLRNHPITSEGGTLGPEYLNEYAADRVQTVGTTFLGLSFNCCRCHDHKFDPLTMDDFYSLQAYFNSITEKHAENDTSSAYAPAIEIASALAPQLGPAKVMIMQERPEPTKTFVLRRGQYDQPILDRPVQRRPPSLFGKPVEGISLDRFGLARWLVSNENPLLGRVTANRIWYQIFGTGIVRTVEDFGVQGEFPSHPELLDELAIELRDGAQDGSSPPWSIKHLVRLIVTSETYRQSSHVLPEQLARDPENRLLSRFPRQRLSAEEIRDQALFSSGLLSNQLGGPAVYPYQPAGLWEERANEASNTKVYQRSEGDALYRRSLYTFWKKTCPPPVMSVFDAPDRLVCTVRRPMTNTPLQALATLNDEQFLECAKFLGARVLKAETDDQQRLRMMFRLTTGRRPDAEELPVLLSGLNRLRTRYRAAPEDAEQLLRQGARPTPTEIDRAELAAWMLMANTLLNLDESLVRN